MLTRFVRRLGFLVLQQWMPACLAGFLILSASPLWAQTFDPTFTVGAGIQASYQHIEPDGGTSLDQFPLNHLRLYFSGDITNYISAMVNTEYNSSTNNMGVLDAVGEFHTSPKFNVWFGRFLPPSDRANLYGPFYANECPGIYRWHPGRLSLCLSGSRQWRRVLGRLQSRDRSR